VLEYSIESLTYATFRSRVWGENERGNPMRRSRENRGSDWPLRSAALSQRLEEFDFNLIMAMYETALRRATVEGRPF